MYVKHKVSRGQLKCDGTRAETRFRLSAKRTSPFKSAGASVQSTTDSRVVRISGINAGYTMFRGSVKGTGYPLHSPVSPSLPLPCVTACHHIWTGVYLSALCPLLNVPKGTTNTTTKATAWRFGNFICVPCRSNHSIRPGTSNYSPTLHNIRTAESNVKTPQTTSHQKQHVTRTSLTSGLHLLTISNFQSCQLRPTTQEKVIVPEQLENLKKTTNLSHVQTPCR